MNTRTSINDRRVVVVNFGHPLSDRSNARISELLDEGGWLHVHIRLNVDFNQPLMPQCVLTVNRAENDLLSIWAFTLEQAGRVCMVAPGLSDPAVLLAFEIAGRTGEYPSLLFQKKDHVNGGYHVYDWMDGIKLRNDARGRRR